MRWWIDTGIMSALEDLLNLVLPAPCALCGSLGAPICAPCHSVLDWAVRETSRDGLLGQVASSYGPSEKALVTAFKEKGHTSLAPFMVSALAGVIEDVARWQADLLLVPVPSSSANYLKRGFSPALILAKRLNSAAGRPARVFDGLRFSRTVYDQSRLDLGHRFANLQGSMAAKTYLSNRNVVLVDDVVTTGATILEAARAATQIGANVIGFFAFSETILKTQSKT
jgi:ComF family protein